MESLRAMALRHGLMVDDMKASGSRASQSEKESRLTKMELPSVVNGKAESSQS